ncbi:MAG: DUF2703 domain-containing protein [Candidatus Kerfeldbacteria bacterium]|nr:DUF2703 domain-containing protein [Candidatus Kerfeldbacteria bacterium]
MQIELFYFDGCPNHEIALQVLTDALDSLDVQAEVSRVRVADDKDAVAKRFLGSPSIRIDGRDLEIKEEAESGYSMRCRRYRDGDRIVGYPPKELVLSALRRAFPRQENSR